MSSNQTFNEVYDHYKHVQNDALNTPNVSKVGVLFPPFDGYKYEVVHVSMKGSDTVVLDCYDQNGYPIKFVFSNSQINFAFVLL
ncbi:hypothetical protein [Vibrio vulnificus]|uniref:hypothetical protein n=1 Tax=Vibrionaceae TaxID=641 RepID=UPI0032EC88CF